MAETINRRTFIRFSGMSLAVAAANPLYAQVRSRGGRPPLLESQLGGQKTLVLVFLRGGCDNLNVCVPTEPTTEYPAYQTYRPTLQLTRADLASTALSSDFALHPALAPIHALYQQGKLAVLPSVHYANGSRSHFDSQAFYESGTPFNKLTPDGWLSRHMATLPGNSSVMRAVSFGTTIPAGFRGRPTALSVSNLASLSVSGFPPRDDQYLATQEAFYAMQSAGRKYDPEVYQTGSDLVSAIRQIRLTSLPGVSNGAVYPSTEFGTRMRELASLVKSGAFSVELAEVDQNGYDTHTGQGVLTGNQPGLLDELARTLAAFYRDLGSLESDVLTLVLTEFGRTARENGSAGTDHGSAMVSFVLGGPVVPGVHFGPQGWISITDLRDGRDTQHSLDYRDVYTEILRRHLGNTSTDAVFPGWTHTPVGFLS